MGCYTPNWLCATCDSGEVVVLPCGTAEGRKKLFEQGWIKKRCELTGAKSPCCSWAGKFVKNVKRAGVSSIYVSSHGTLKIMGTFHVDDVEDLYMYGVTMCSALCHFLRMTSIVLEGLLWTYSDVKNIAPWL